MNFRCKFRHRRSIPRPQFPIRVQNFGDSATFYVDFCILYFECPPYFYFRFVWPTDLESIPHASTPTSILPTKFEVDMTIHCRVIAFCLLIRHVSVLEFWVITFTVDYHWKCVRGYCACAESRDLLVGDQKQLHFWNPRPWFAYSLCTFGGYTINVIKVICENNARPCVKKTHQFLRMREFTWSVIGNLNVLLHSISTSSIYRTGL